MQNLGEPIDPKKEEELNKEQEAWEKSHSMHDLLDHRTYPGWEYSEARPQSGGVTLKFANGYTWEVDEHGWHRIVDDKGLGGPWSSYDSIAYSADGNYICLTQYYLGCLPVEALLEIKVIACLNR